jgi:colanic acid biosynthesis glycosyl transferase WcaI
MSKPLHVLFLSMHYKPEPCDTRTSELAQGMAARGHRATALTSFPNYPFGKVYDGYRQSLREKKRIDGVNVVRVPMVPDHSMSKKRRAISYLSFGASAAFLGALFTKRPDLLWIHHPPLTTGIAGYLLAKIKRVPYVYEIHDLWPETLVSTGMIREGRVTNAIQKVCDFLHKRAAAIVVTSNGMRDHLVSQGVAEHKVHVFHQWAREGEDEPAERSPAFAAQFGLEGKFNVLFTGNMGVAQGLDTVLDAAARLSDVSDLQIVMVGAGVELERLRERATSEGLNNVKFVGQIPRESMPSMFAWADGLLVHLKNDPLFAITIPSKVQVYMAAGRPVLCGVAGDAADLVREFDCGLCFPPDDADAMASAIRELYRTSPERRVELGANARRAQEATSGHDMLLDRYEELFFALLDRPKGFLKVVSRPGLEEAA